MYVGVRVCGWMCLRMFVCDGCVGCVRGCMRGFLWVCMIMGVGLGRGMWAICMSVCVWYVGVCVCVCGSVCRVYRIVCMRISTGVFPFFVCEGVFILYAVVFVWLCGYIYLYRAFYVCLSAVGRRRGECLYICTCICLWMFVCWVGIRPTIYIE